MWMMPLHLHVNQKSDYDDDDMNQQYIKLNTGAKEIQQVNPSGPDNSQNHQAPTFSSIDQSIKLVRMQRSGLNTIKYHT